MATILYETGDLRENEARFQAMLLGPDAPTAIFSIQDYRLVTKRDLLRRLGLTVPDDLALVGYNNTPWYQAFDVPLSSVSIREEEIAALVVERLLATDGKAGRFIIKPELIARASSLQEQ